MTKEKTGFARLKEINVNEHVEKKNNFSYLSWPWALSTLMESDPEAEWSHPEEKIYGDGTVMVYCIVKAFSKERKAHLPVMDHKNQPIKNPNAFQINTAMQRCFVKAIALHGLGLYLYAGEDLPAGEEKPTEFTRENKIVQRDILFDVANCEDEVAIDSVNEKWAKAFEAMPDPMLDVINDAIDMKKQQFANKVPFKPAVFGFIDTEEATEYFSRSKEFIGKQDNLQKLTSWIANVDHKLKALDGKLNAKKYQNGDGSPYQQVIKVYSIRVQELQNVSK